MKTRNFFLVLLIVVISTTFCLSAFSQVKKKTSKTYDVAAFVWPSYHPDDRAKIFWPNGIGEWQSVMSNKAKFPGHQQPRYPLWGYVNEADPYVMEMQINAATRHGVNVFIYDWYWYDGMPFLEGCLNDGFLGAANSTDMKFYLMWANHDVNMTWDKRLAGMPNNALVWKAGLDRKEFEKICLRIIEKYFKLSNYYKVDGKPSFMIYELPILVEGLGGIKETQDALDWFRKQVVKAGFPGLDLQLSLRKANYDVMGLGGESSGTQKEVVKTLGFDGGTHYQYCHFLNIDRDYLEIQADAVKEWETIDKEYNLVYYPHISIGWDNNPRFEHFVGGIVKNNTPANFQKALEDAKAYVDAHPDQAPLITINSWNEWTETSYLQPCTMFGYGYLEAVKAVFVDRKNK